MSPVSRERNNSDSGKNLCGIRIKALREARGISLVELSAELELDYGVKLERSVIGKIEHGKRKINDFELVAIALVLGVKVEELLPDSPQKALRDLKKSGRGRRA